MLKKMMLLAMSVAALVAFAAPSMASADQWETNGVPIGNQANADTVTLTGTLSSTKSGLKISCNATAKVELWNTAGVAHGQVESPNGLVLTQDPVGTNGCTVAAFNPGTGTYVDVPNCHVNATSKNFPWTIRTNGTNVIIGEAEKANFANEFVGVGCLPALGILSGTVIEEVATAAGVTGVVPVGTATITFANSGHFKGGAVIDGSLTGPAALRLT